MLRFGNVVGRRQTHGVGFDFVRGCREDPTRLEVMGDGTQSKSYVLVTDVVDAVLLAARSGDGEPFRAYNVATGDYITVREIVELAIEVARARSRRRRGLLRADEPRVEGRRARRPAVDRAHPRPRVVAERRLARGSAALDDRDARRPRSRREPRRSSSTATECSPKRMGVDGVPQSPRLASDMRIDDEAPAATRALQEAGFVTVCITNQPEIARGELDPGELERMHAELDAA